MNTQEAITPAQTQAFSMGLLVNPAAILANQRESNHGLSQNVFPPQALKKLEFIMAWGARKTQKIGLSFLSVKMIFPAGCSGAHIGTQR